MVPSSLPGTCKQPDGYYLSYKQSAGASEVGVGFVFIPTGEGQESGSGLERVS